MLKELGGLLLMLLLVILVLFYIRKRGFQRTRDTVIGNLLEMEIVLTFSGIECASEFFPRDELDTPIYFIR